MTQAQLDELVASATGDDLREVRRLGFHLVATGDVDLEEQDFHWPPQAVDWDLLEQARNEFNNH